MVHLFRGADAREGARILSLLPRLPASERPRILDFGQEQGTVFFLTLDLPGNLAFSKWIEAVFHPGQPVPVAPAPIPVAPERPVRQQRSPEVPVRRAPPAPPPPPPQPALSPDGFTQFFGGRPASTESTTTTNDSFEVWAHRQPEHAAPIRPAPPPPPPPRLEARNHISPILATDAGLAARRADSERAPRRVRDSSNTNYRAAVQPRFEDGSWGSFLKPWLITMGIILGVAVLVVLIWDYFSLS